jgi:hypothetical protein
MLFEWSVDKPAVPSNHSPKAGHFREKIMRVSTWKNWKTGKLEKHVSD